MKKVIFSCFLLLGFLQLRGQFSIGMDLFGGSLSRAYQQDIGLKQDTTNLNSRFVFSGQSNLSLGYRLKSWEFTIGAGYRQSNWNQRFYASPQELKDFVGSNSLSDSSDYFGKVAYTGRYYTFPIGAKYLIGAKNDSWIHAFVGAQIIPSFAYQRLAKPKFFSYNFLFSTGAEEDPALVEATRAYFLPKVSDFALDAKLEFGARFGGKRTGLDFSLGYLQGFKPLHAQMGAPKGMFVNLAFRYFFSKKAPAAATTR